VLQLDGTCSLHPVAHAFSPQCHPLGQHVVQPAWGSCAKAFYVFAVAPQRAVVGGLCRNVAGLQCNPQMARFAVRCLPVPAGSQLLMQLQVKCMFALA
jgi:hypothetical protein